MSTVRIAWTQGAKRQFDELRLRARERNREPDLIALHNHVVNILTDLESATQKGDPLYRTKKPGGVVYHFLYQFISVTYVIFADERAGWLIKYSAVPASWPDGEAQA